MQTPTTTIASLLNATGTTASIPSTTPPQRRSRFTVGLLVTETQQGQIGFSLSGGAIPLALQRIQSEHLLDGVEFEYVINYTDCTEANAAGVAIDMMQKRNVDVIIGPACANAIIPVALLANFYRKMQIVWGYASSYVLADNTRFSMLSTLIPNYRQLGYALIALTQNFYWDTVALMYGDLRNGVCDNMIAGVAASLNDPSANTSIATTIRVDIYGLSAAASRAAMSTALRRVKSRARIVAFCMPNDENKRNFLIAASQAGMMGGDYIYIMLSLRGYAMGQLGRVAGQKTDGYTPIWVDTYNSPADGLDSIAQNAANNLFVIDLNNAGTANGRTTAEVTPEVLSGVRGAPLYCNTTECLYNSKNFSGIASFTPQLYDSFLYYAYVLNKTFDADPIYGFQNWTLFNIVRTSVSFQGWSGTIMMTPNSTRVPRMYLYGLTSLGAQIRFMNFTWLGTGDYMVATPLYVDEATTIWANHNGTRPLSTPLCGFNGDQCPKSTWEKSGKFICIGIGVVILLCVLTAILGIFISREKRREMARQDAEWQIPFHTLERPGSAKNDERAKSHYSLNSSKSAASKLSKASEKSETDETAFFLLNNEPIMSYKYKTAPKLSPLDYAEFRQLRKLEHDNVHRFIGIVHDHIPMMSVWKFASRGTLEEVIGKGAITLDAFFAISLIKDLVEGLDFIHRSFLGVHGNLSSTTCWMDERWQLKVSGFGCATLRKPEQPEPRKKLWIAPELIRDAMAEPSKQSDIYSFAIICSEIVTRKSAFDLPNRAEELEELLYMLKRVSHEPTRPDLTIPEEMELNPALMHLIRDCWDENKNKRPDIVTIKSVLQPMSNSKGAQQNLMDHVFKIMESYAETLEKEVENRMAELVEEQKKSDLLLYRMLPRQVADRLKLGQLVEPESFDSVTIFFSDVVQFTNLAAKCTPLQIVTLLNELYTTFDTTIERHQVYKVETIGDGYLCVSGLPKRNGNQHVKDIAEMSLEFYREVQMFRVPHLPAESVNLRIGMHSGSCVAGVVGLAMPRYCLFGDTVNTASRMESNGKPGKIHMSGAAAALLTRMGGYIIEPRGEVMIKGKGVMETYWLEGRVGKYATPLETTPEMRTNRSNASTSSNFLGPRSISPMAESRRSSTASNPPNYEGMYRNLGQH